VSAGVGEQTFWGHGGRSAEAAVRAGNLGWHRFGNTFYRHAGYCDSYPSKEREYEQVVGEERSKRQEARAADAVAQQKIQEKFNAEQRREKLGPKIEEYKRNMQEAKGEYEEAKVTLSTALSQKTVEMSNLRRATVRLEGEQRRQRALNGTLLTFKGQLAKMERRTLQLERDADNLTNEAIRLFEEAGMAKGRFKADQVALNMRAEEAEVAARDFLHELDRTGEMIHSLQGRRNATTHAIDELKRQLKELRATHELMVEELTASESKLEQLQDEYESVASDRRGAMETAQAAKEAEQDATNANLVIQQRLATLQDEMARLARATAEGQTSVAASKMTIKRLEITKKRLQKELQPIVQQLLVLSDKQAELQERSSGVVADDEAVTKELERARKRLKMSVTRAKQAEADAAGRREKAEQNAIGTQEAHTLVSQLRSRSAKREADHVKVIAEAAMGGHCDCSKEDATCPECELQNDAESMRFRARRRRGGWGLFTAIARHVARAFPKYVDEKSPPCKKYDAAMERIGSARRDLEHASNLLSASNNKKSLAEQQAAVATAETARLEAQAAQLRQAISTFQKETKEANERVEAINTLLVKVRKVVDESTESADAAAAESETLQAEIDQVSTQKNEQSKFLDRATRVTSRIQEIKSREEDDNKQVIADIARQEGGLRQQVDSSERATAMLKVKIANATAFEKTLSDSENLAEELEADLSRQQAQAQEDAQDMSERIGSLRDSLSKLSIKKDLAIRQTQEAKEAAAASAQSTTTAREEEKKAHLLLAPLRAKVERAKVAVHGTSSEGVQLEAEQQGLQSEVNRMENSVSSKREEVIALKSRLTEMAETAEQRKSHAKVTETLLHSLEGDQEHADRKADAAEAIAQQEQEALAASAERRAKVDKLMDTMAKRRGLLTPSAQIHMSELQSRRSELESALGGKYANKAAKLIEKELPHVAVGNLDAGQERSTSSSDKLESAKQADRDRLAQVMEDMKPQLSPELVSVDKSFKQDQSTVDDLMEKSSEATALLTGQTGSEETDSLLTGVAPPPLEPPTGMDSGEPPIPPSLTAL
jgi:chromosome segregation ATPase